MTSILSPQPRHRTARSAALPITALSALVFALVSLAQPDAVHAAQVYQTDDTTLSLGGVLRAGWEATHADDTFDHGPWLGVARLNAGATYRDAGDVYIQLSGDSTGVQLLDARLTVHLTHWLSWNVGRLKAPVSLEYTAVGAPALPFATRFYAGALAPRRLYGTSLSHQTDFNRSSLSIEAGVYATAANPANPQRDDLVFASRVAFDPAPGVTLHLGFSEQLERNEDQENGPSGDPERTERDFGRVIDVGVAARKGAWNIHAEAIAQLQEDTGRAWGYVVMGGYRVRTANAPFDVEPIVSFDSLFATDLDATTHRGRAGVRLLWREVPLNVTFSGFAADTDGALSCGGHVFAQFTL